MRFIEAEQKYRELEEQLVRGELVEEDFLIQVAQLRVVDVDGRRWMISARTGRWLVHDGQRWVFAEPSPEEVKAPAEVEDKPQTELGETDSAATVITPTPEPEARARKSRPPRPLVPRLLTTSVLALLVIGCLIGGGIAAWVFLVRDWAAATPTSDSSGDVALVETYTPRPATSTFTPTPSPTASRTPTPTITPMPTDTPIATSTVSPTPEKTPAPPTSTSQASAASPTAAASSTPSPTVILTVTPAPPSTQSYTVELGDTLFEIALRFGVSVNALAEANGITDPALIRPGQVLVIPLPGTTPLPPTPTSTPTWTPIVLATRATTSTPTSEVISTPTATRTATPTPTESGPTATATPTNTPKPTATPTPVPVVLSGKIAFTVWNPYINKYELYVSRIDGEGRNLLGEGFRQPQFRQDGNLLATNGDGAPEYEHLVTMNASGGDKVQVSNYSEDSFPTWSPDGAIVAYSSSSWGDGLTRLGIVNDMFGLEQNWIPYGAIEIRGEYPFWMADGRIVYHGCDFVGDQAACGLYWVGAGGGNYVRLTTDFSDTAPSGSGSRVAFMSARDGNWEVYRVNIDGSGLKRLTNNNAQDGLPTWSPDGTSIAFVSNRDGVWAIWVMNADGSNQRKLFDLGGGYGSGDYDWTRERISWAP